VSTSGTVMGASGQLGLRVGPEVVFAVNQQMAEAVTP
jgi:hypothetical protein